MELSLIAFLHRALDYTMDEIFKMLFLVIANFIFMGLILWRLRRPMMKLYHLIVGAMESIPEMKNSMDNLNKTLQEHIVQTDLRMTEGDKNFEELRQEIRNLKNYVYNKIPKEG